MFRRRAEDELQWKCKFCKVGVGNTHSCTTIVTPTHLVVRWWSGPIERERKFHARNLLRASIVEEGPSPPRVTVHVLTYPDSSGESEYKQYDMTAFQSADGQETFAAAVNAIAFTVRPLSGRCLIFVNPVSGSRQGPQRFKMVRHLFLLVGLEADVITTTHHGHASEIVMASDLTKYSAIIAISGDGTLNEIFTALIARPDSANAVKTPVGIIPAGSEGTLAKICTFFHPLAAALVILKCHEVRPLDVLEITQHDLTMYSQCGVGWDESRPLWQVLPARERPLCACSPGCLRCRSGASMAEREALLRLGPLLPPLGNGAGGEGGGDEEEGEEDKVAITLGACRGCGGVFTCAIEGVPQPCPKEDHESGDAESCESGGEAHATPGSAGEEDGQGGATRPPRRGGSALPSPSGSAYSSGSRLVHTPSGGVLAVRRVLPPSRDPLASPGAAGLGLGGRHFSGSLSSTPGGGSQAGGTPRWGDRGSEMVVPIDYQRRLLGMGDAADRGSALLQVSQQWRGEVERPDPAGRDAGGGAAGAAGPWQRLQGEFLAIGALNTERISAPFAHMSDGCMDVIALPAAVGAVGLIQMGAKLSTGDHVHDRRIFHWKAVAMRFTPESTADKFNLDGEVLDGLPIEARVLPSLCRLISVLPPAD
ncbi:hypothetical protein T484DRAFT_1931375 [Baffinella frigidus]|nr:hypothetical protein T484DRAFT_1931375 [Cryptophyta sp. CCMP2293]